MARYEGLCRKLPKLSKPAARHVEFEVEKCKKILSSYLASGAVCPYVLDSMLNNFVKGM